MGSGKADDEEVDRNVEHYSLCRSLGEVSEGDAAEQEHDAAAEVAGNKQDLATKPWYNEAHKVLSIKKSDMKHEPQFIKDITNDRTEAISPCCLKMSGA